MSFRFNFPHSSENSEDNILESYRSESNSDTVDDTNFNHCDFLSLINKNLKSTGDTISILRVEDLEVKYVLINSIKLNTEDEVFSQINTMQTDLIPGKYEGGLKIWECSIDLASYVIKHNCIKDGDTVLELGCGGGLPGIVAYIQGAAVTFQDFNPEVLEYFTLPNTVLNTSEDKLDKIPEVCHYLYGDWGAIYKKFYCDLNTGKKYDVILTSETIYEIANQKKLLELMKCALKPEGTIYLAAKIHYFGVGGGIVDFETLLNFDKTFEIVSVHRITEGVERQILIIKFRSSI